MEISLKGFGFNFILTSLGSFSQSAFFIFSSTWYITHIPHCLKSMWSWTIWNLTWQCSLFSLNFNHLLDSHTPERDDIVSLGNVWLEKDEKAVEMQPVLFMNLSVITDHFFFPHDISLTFSIASKPCDTGQNNWNLRCSLFSLNFSHLLDLHIPIYLRNVWLEKDERVADI